MTAMMLGVKNSATPSAWLASTARVCTSRERVCLLMFGRQTVRMRVTGTAGCGTDVLLRQGLVPLQTVAGKPLAAVEAAKWRFCSSITVLKQTMQQFLTPSSAHGSAGGCSYAISAHICIAGHMSMPQSYCAADDLAGLVTSKPEERGLGTVSSSGPVGTPPSGVVHRTLLLLRL